MLGQKALEHLHHWDHFVRRAALALLREAVQTEETIEALLTLLEDESVRHWCGPVRVRPTGRADNRPERKATVDGIQCKSTNRWCICGVFDVFWWFFAWMSAPNKVAQPFHGDHFSVDGLGTFWEGSGTGGRLQSH